MRVPVLFCESFGLFKKHGVGEWSSYGVDVSNWNYDCSGQLKNDVYRPATTALNWNGLTVDQWFLLDEDGWDNLLADHVPTGGAGLLAYSPTGNRLTQTDPVTGDITTFAYDSGNRLLTAVDVSGTTTHTYDDNGNQLTIAEPSGDITTNTWDGENRLIQVEHPSGDVTTYAYNGDGLRVLQDDGVAETRFVYDGNNLVLELDDVGVVKADVTYLPAEYATAISQHRDLESSFYLCDGIHNVRQLTDDAQVVTDEYSFDGWGKLTSSTGSTANSQLYKGEYLAYRKDPDAGPELQYSTHHRNYNPQTGVFTAADPAKDDLNLYRYVKNNPVNQVDPSGLQEDESAKEPQQPIEFTKAPLEDFAAKMLGSKELGNAFIKFQGTSAGDRLVDLMTWGWQIRIEGFHFRSTIDKPYHVDAPKHELQIYKGSSTYTGGEYGGSESQTLYDTKTLCENIKLAIYDNRVTEGNRDSGPESTLFAGVSAFADHPNIGIIVGTIEVVGGVALIAGSGGSAIPIIIGGYSALRGLENAGTSTYESVTGKEARAPSHQLADMATGDQQTTDRIFFWTDIGLAVVDLANGARLYLKTVKAAKTTATEAVRVGDAALSSAADAGKVADAVPSTPGTLVDETTDALKNADATAASSATSPSGTTSPPPEPTVPSSTASLDPPSPVPASSSAPNEILDSPSANPSTTKLDDGNVAPTSVASSTRALTVGSKVKLRIIASRYTASERRMIDAAIDETNLRIAGGAETSVVGQQVPFSSYQSRRYIRDRFFPDKPVSQVKVSDADELMGFTVNVDEIVPRQIGGRQVFENQRVLSERLNKALGPIEERVLRSQPEGMRVQGFYIEWY